MLELTFGFLFAVNEKPAGAAGGDEPRDNQGTVRWSTHKWPIPEYPHLGKRSDRMAISR